MKRKSHLHTPTCVLGPRFCNPRPESHYHGRSTGYFRRRQSLSTLSIGLRGYVRVYALSDRNSSSDHAVGSQYSYYIPLDVCVSLAARPPRLTYFPFLARAGMVPLPAMSVLSCCWTLVTLSIGRSFAVHFFVYDGALVTPVR